MNKGIEKCSGKIISLLNSDDWYEKDALSQIFDFSKNSHVEIAHGNLIIIAKEKSNIISKKNLIFFG